MSEVLDEKSKLPIFAPDDLLEELTGYKAPHKQIEWLAKNGWIFIVNSANHPKVLMEVVLHRMGSPSAKPIEIKQERKWKPNYNNLVQGNTS